MNPAFNIGDVRTRCWTRSLTPAQASLKCIVRFKQSSHCLTCLYVCFFFLIIPKPSAQQMFDSFGLAKFDRDVAAGGVVVREDAAQSPNPVPTLKPFDDV